MSRAIAPNTAPDLALLRTKRQEILRLAESASLLSQAVKDRYPEITWTAIAGFRNRLVHGYTEVNIVPTGGGACWLPAGGVSWMATRLTLVISAVSV